MIARRIALVAAGLLWVGMLGALGVMEHRRRAQSEVAAGQLDSVFGPDAPAFVNKSIRMQEFGGAEQIIGYVETQIQLTGPNEALIKTTLSVDGAKIPPLTAAAISQVLGSQPENLSGELNVYTGRAKGISRIDGKGSYGEERLEFMATRFRDKELKLITRRGRERSPPTFIPYDRDLPFTGDLSPIRGSRGLKTGDSWTVTHFNPMTRTAAETMIRVEGEAVLRHRNEDFRCWVLKSHPVSASGAGAGGSFGVSTATAWVARKPGDKLDGQVIREEAQMLFFRVALVLEDFVTREEASRDRLDSDKRGGGTPGRGPAVPDRTGGPAR
ncbi:MAG TPA: hypothetical protein PK280_06165 [Planctomycetota bacterium]|nr:hypothetical protein [Planctomycetota bacterium]